MSITAIEISIELLESNQGQINGLPKNPRFIRDEKFDKLVSSIKDFPEMLEYRELLVFPHNEKYVIIGGNMRYEAMKHLGYKIALCKVLPVNFSVEKLKELTLKDNMSYGEYDWNLIINEWDAELLAEWGLDIPEIEELETEEEQNFLKDEDDIPSIREESISIKGDIWLLGNHRLMNGDSIMFDDVAKLMNGELAQMVLTDPPYNIAVTSQNKNIKGDQIMNDNMDSESFREFMYNVYTNYFTYMEEGAVIYVFHGESERHTFTAEFKNSGLKLSQILIWVKSTATFGRQDFNWQHEPIIAGIKGDKVHEPILYGWKEGKGHFFIGDFTKTTVINYDKPTKSDLHPTMKPVGLCEEMITWSSKKEWIVLDLFGGSGTTLIACEKAKRKARIMELDPKYCDVIIRRWQELTGKDATLESTGETFNILTKKRGKK
jgi:site-specific DNA-methyltransferase (adenine-specific)